jgi:hypothetical protein
MGCDAWGLSVTAGTYSFGALVAHPVLIGDDNWSSRIHESTCGNYLIVDGAFFTFVLAVKDQSLALYKATIRGDDQVWCEETPIYKTETVHLNGANGKHYYLQYPFVTDSQFWDAFHVYEQLRLTQIGYAKNA